MFKKSSTLQISLDYLRSEQTMAHQSPFERIATKFMAVYKDGVIKRTRNLSDTHRFHSLIRSNEFARSLYGLSQTLCNRYENDEWQARVLDTIDLETIYGNIDATQGSEDDYTDRLVRELLRFFKNDFFKWCDKPECIKCGSNQHQNLVGHQGPNAEESQFDCGVVEVHKCQSCAAITRFPRYNNPVKLLETRRGRCGEWCNLFTLILKSFGIEARYVWNREDHVWCEFYSTFLKRWVHVDACEQSFDEPHIYSVNWNKKMSYVIAFEPYSCVDVSKRYIIQNQLPRDQIKEDDLQFLLDMITRRQRMLLTDDEVYVQACRDEQERLQWIDSTKSSNSDLPTQTNSAAGGRESGSAAWKEARGEDGKR